MLIFISGPYAKPDPVINTRNAILAGERIVKTGHAPFIPHLNHLWHLLCPHNKDFWYQYDLIWLKKCNAILRLPGESTGADREMKLAKKWGIKEVTFDSLRGGK